MPEPRADESKDEYIGRCIPMLIDEGKEPDQATAICHSMWENKEKKEKEWVEKFDNVIKGCKPKEPEERKKPKK